MIFAASVSHNASSKAGEWPFQRVFRGGGGGYEVELVLVHFKIQKGLLNTVKPVTNDHPLGPEKAVFSGRWSLVR